MSLCSLNSLISLHSLNSLFLDEIGSLGFAVGRNWLAVLFGWTKLARWALLLDEIGSLGSAVGRNWLAALADLVTP